MAAIARSQKVTLKVAESIYKLANGDKDGALDALQEVAELSRDAQLALSDMILGGISHNG